MKRNEQREQAFILLFEYLFLAPGRPGGDL